MFDFFKKLFSSEIGEVPTELKSLEGLPQPIVIEAQMGGQHAKFERPTATSRLRTHYTSRK